MGRWPGGAEREFTRRTAVEVPHPPSQRRIRPIESPGERRAEDAEPLLGRVDLDRWIHGQQIVQTCRMVAMTVRDHDEIQLLEINPQGTNIVREHLRVVARVKEDPLPTVLDKGGEAPVAREASATPKRIVKDRHSAGGSLRGGGGGKGHPARQ